MLAKDNEQWCLPTPRRNRQQQAHRAGLPHLPLGTPAPRVPESFCAETLLSEPNPTPKPTRKLPKNLPACAKRSTSSPLDPNQQRLAGCAARPSAMLLSELT